MLEFLNRLLANSAPNELLLLLNWWLSLSLSVVTERNWLLELRRRSPKCWISGLVWLYLLAWGLENILILRSSRCCWPCWNRLSSRRSRSSRLIYLLRRIIAHILWTVKRTFLRISSFNSCILIELVLPHRLAHGI